MTTQERLHHSHRAPGRHKRSGREALLLALIGTAVVAVLVMVAVVLTSRPAGRHPVAQSRPPLGVDATSTARTGSTGRSTPTPTPPATPTGTGSGAGSATATHTSGAGSSPTAGASTTPRQAVQSSQAVYYTVQPGDTLTSIAAWYKLQGYQPLYDWNASVIGQNPDLIFPGQPIIVVPGGTVSVEQQTPAN